MQYLLTPLHTHADFGFGATGDAFKEAADKLESLLGPRGELFNERLPINYLRRHAVELYLKSAIVIIHRCLRLPYGDVPFDGSDPRALVQGKWVHFTRLHSVRMLWVYVKDLFSEHKRTLDSIGQTDWTIPTDVDSWIEAIEQNDPRSTFFRYPNPQDTQSDAPKAVMVEARPEDILAHLNRNPDEKQFILLMKNEAGEVTRGYYYEGESLQELREILRNCAGLFYGMHAALRVELCGGA